MHFTTVIHHTIEKFGKLACQILKGCQRERLTNCISNIKICPIAHHRWMRMYQQMNNPNTATGSKIVGLRSIDRLNPPTRNSHKQLINLTYSLSNSMSVISILKGSRGSICLIMFTCFCTIRHIPLYLPPQNSNYLHRVAGRPWSSEVPRQDRWQILPLELTQHSESIDPFNVRSEGTV
jgi:hypothetical protein